MSGIPLQEEIFYGPVLSRRFGRSFGINLLPKNRKLCSFDCVYCEYGRTPLPSLTANGDRLPTVSEVVEAIEKALKKPRTIESLTFSGNGEPTLHPDFLEIVREVKNLRDRYCPKSNLVLLSNASTLDRPDVVEAIGLFDVPVMKLDAGDEGTFKRINQPLESISFSDIISGLRQLSGWVLQTMFLAGNNYNAQGKPFNAWLDAIASLKPKRVQIYSATRPTALDGVMCLSHQQLQQIKEVVKHQTGLVTEAF
jgi:wyosine [tRNA(Phe)-imidazoG37] synthetase (radical SAM superfamily)